MTTGESEGQPTRDLYWRARLHVFLFCLLVLPALLGSLSAYLTVLFACLFLPESARHSRLLLDERVYLPVVAGFMLLVVAFAITAREPRDLVAVMNFSIIPLSALAYPAFRAKGRPQDLVQVAGYALAGAAVSFAVGLFSLQVLQVGRADALMQSNPLHFAHVAMMQGWISSIGMMVASHRWRRLFWLGPALGLVVAFMADARGLVIAFPMLLLLAVMLPRAGESAHHRGWILLGLVPVGGIAALLFGGGSRLGSAFANLGTMVQGHVGSDQSLNERLGMWIGGVRAFLESPVVGHGWRDKMEVALAAIPPDWAAQLTRFTRLHSDPLDFVVSGGALGISGYALIAAGPMVVSSLRPRSPLRLHALSLVCATALVCGLTNSFLGYESQTVLYAFAIALISALTAAPRTTAQQVAPTPHM